MKVEADMLLSPTQSDVFADQPRSHARVVTAQVLNAQTQEIADKKAFSTLAQHKSEL